MKTKTMAWAVWGLNVADWALTKVALDNGLATEANPLLAGWITGPWGFLAKTVGVGVAVWLLWARDARRVLMAALAVYAVLVAYTVGGLLWTI